MKVIPPVISGSGDVGGRESFAIDSKTINHTHNLGIPPLVMYVPTGGLDKAEYLNVIHSADFNSFTYESVIQLTGTIYIS